MRLASYANSIDQFEAVYDFIFQVLRLPFVIVKFSLILIS